MKKRPSSSSSSSSSSSPTCSSSSSNSSSCIAQILSPIQPLKPPRSRTKDPATPKSRSSIYRGVTRHRWTGRYEAHLWDKSSWNPVQNKRGRQIYLGAYDNQEDAARTYDLAALKYWGPNTILNFPVQTYDKDIAEMEKMTKEEYLASLRRQSSGFSRGVSKYRGVARHHQNGRWEARIGRVRGNKYLYLGTFGTQEEAAEAYDLAAIEFRGPNAITNFDINKYAHVLKNLHPNEQSQRENDQTKFEINPTLPDESSPIDTPLYHKEDENKTAQRQSTPINSPVVATIEPSPTPTEAPRHPWDDLCLEVGFDLPIPDIPMEQTSSDVLDYKGFEDNIEFIFDGPVDDTEMFLQDASSSSGTCNNNDVEAAMALVPLDASSSPESSTMTTSSVCSNSNM